jgi:hypothetical protein
MFCLGLPVKVLKLKKWLKLKSGTKSSQKLPSELQHSAAPAP